MFPHKYPGLQPGSSRETEAYIDAGAEDPSGSGKYSQLAIYTYGPIRIVMSDAGGGNTRSDTNLHTLPNMALN